MSKLQAGGGVVLGVEGIEGEAAIRSKDYSASSKYCRLVKLLKCLGGWVAGMRDDRRRIGGDFREDLAIDCYDQ